MPFLEHGRVSIFTHGGIHVISLIYTDFSGLQSRDAGVFLGLHTCSLNIFAVYVSKIQSTLHRIKFYPLKSRFMKLEFKA